MALHQLFKNLSVDEMIGLVLKCGEIAVKTMALLDKAIQRPMAIQKLQRLILAQETTLAY
jgi:hypothetical protein